MEKLNLKKFELSDNELLSLKGGRKPGDLTTTDEATNSECSGTGDSWQSSEEPGITDHCDIECGTTDTESSCIIASR